MQEFMMIFRMAPVPGFQPTPEQMQESIQQWQDWIGGIAAQGKFLSTNQLGFTGNTLHSDGVITDGPYAEVKEIVGGYINVKAENLEAATEMAKGCPILFVGGHVEIREIMQINL
jgi:prepilin-type processing-associated H-X9-DG protein